MARNPEIEKILEAWWQSEHCVPAERAKLKRELEALLDAGVAKSKNLYTREQILNCFWSQYKDFRHERKKREQVAVAQTLRK